MVLAGLRDARERDGALQVGSVSVLSSVGVQGGRGADSDLHGRGGARNRREGSPVRGEYDAARQRGVVPPSHWKGGPSQRHGDLLQSGESISGEGVVPHVPSEAKQHDELP